MNTAKMNWLAADWPAPDFIKAGTTLRQGGVSITPYASFNLATHVGDDVAAVKKNRTILNDNVPDAPQWLEQIHSTKVVLLPNEDVIPKADAAYTLKKDIVCAVMTADCLPLLMTDKRGSFVAVAHAGWRGLCDGIIEMTIKKVAVDPANVLVWLGPAIGSDAYEVGEDVYTAFIDQDSEAKSVFSLISDKRWHLDLYSAAKQRLNKIGIQQVFGGGFSTFKEDERFFSYRRDGVTGRMASLIWIER